MCMASVGVTEISLSSMTACCGPSRQVPSFLLTQGEYVPEYDSMIY